jgi:phthalate 4,5-dioxygenase oxygenase subunit
MIDAMQKNETGTLGVDSDYSGPPTIDGIGPTATIDEYWKESDLQRRQQAKWAA